MLIQRFGSAPDLNMPLQGLPRESLMKGDRVRAEQRLAKLGASRGHPWTGATSGWSERPASPARPRCA